MRVRLLLVAATVVAAFPLTGAGAEHCGSQIYLFSYVSGPVADPLDPQRQMGNLTVTSSAIGCTIIATDDPAIPGDESDTDVIYPGSNTLVVRWLPGEIPAGGGTLTFAGVTHQLEFYHTTNYIIPVLDSKQIYIDPASSINGGDAVITVCADEAQTECDTRTYRTLL